MRWQKLTCLVLTALVGIFVPEAASLAAATADPPSHSHLVPCPRTEVDSAAAIQAALESAAPGETIALEAGTYYLAKAVWVRTAFRGALRGAGKDLTFIKILPGSKIQGIPISLWGGANYSTLFYFDIPMGASGDIAVSDFSIEVTDPEPAKGVQDDDADWWHGALYNLFVISGGTPYNPNSPTPPAQSIINTSFERLSLKASAGSFSGSEVPADNFSGTNVAHAFHIFGPGLDQGFMTGTHAISGVDMERMFVSYNVGSQKDSCIKVLGNTFLDTAYGPTLEDLENSQVDIASNKIKVWLYGGVVIAQGNGGWWPYRPSTYVVSHNDIEAITLADGMLLLDWAHAWDGWTKLNAVVSSNTLTLNSDWGGIYLGGTQGLVVTNNKISGRGLAGIYAGAWGWDGVANCSFKANNLTQMAAAMAPIWLGPASSGCIVLGGDLTTKVFDEGVDNSVFGVDRTTGLAPGPAIADAMKRKRDMIRMIRGPRR